MTKDNNILGEFYLYNVPRGPKGSHKFDNEFSLDADGILTVTTTHVQTGNKHSLTLDSRSSGRMSNDEVNEVIARAERMRESDEQEAKRVEVRTALETLCQEIKFASAFSGSPTDIKSQMLMDTANGCLAWLKQNKEADEATYQRRLKNLERESGIGNVLEERYQSYGASNRELESCFASGDLCLSQYDIPGACEWFYKAYKQAGNKEKEQSYRALLLIGQACRKYAHMETDSVEQTKVERFIYRGACLLVFELKAGAMTSFCLELAAELGKLKDVFFEKVST